MYRLNSARGLITVYFTIRYFTDILLFTSLLLFSVLRCVKIILLNEYGDGGLAAGTRNPLLICKLSITMCENEISRPCDDCDVSTLQCEILAGCYLRD